MMAEAFGRAYALRYGRPPPAVPIELVHARVVQRGQAGSAMATLPPPAATPAAGRSRRAVFPEGMAEAVVLDRAALPPGFVAAGPALVEEAGSTLVIGPRGRFTVLASGNILVEIG
jgi:N-methylhydantoinase A